MPIITVMHLRETMSKFRLAAFLGYFEFDNSLFVKLNCSLVDLSSSLEETQPVQWLKHR